MQIKVQLNDIMKFNGFIDSQSNVCLLNFNCMNEADLVTY